MKIEMNEGFVFLPLSDYEKLKKFETFGTIEEFHAVQKILDSGDEVCVWDLFGHRQFETKSESAKKIAEMFEERIKKLQDQMLKQAEQIAFYKNRTLWERIFNRGAR